MGIGVAERLDIHKERKKNILAEESRHGRVQVSRGVEFMFHVPVPWSQFLLMALFVRKQKTCEDGWLKAGQTRRMATVLWGTTFIVHGSMESLKNGNLGLTSDEIFPAGFDNLKSEDIQRWNEQIELWLDYWSGRHPDDTLHKAMLNMLGRVLKIKRHWTEERQQGQFPFDHALREVRSERFEALMAGVRVQ